jgi:ribose/xylose/arabinose/galactoside ABC-type transport system permease subunit
MIICQLKPFEITKNLGDENMAKQIGIRTDKGWLPIIVFVVVGFLLGVAMIFLIALHPIFDGLPMRHYPFQLYFLSGCFVAVATLVLSYIYAWAFHLVDEDLEGE